MVMKKKIYIAGPRMGQNNSAYGIEESQQNLPRLRTKQRRKSNG